MDATGHTPAPWRLLGDDTEADVICIAGPGNDDLANVYDNSNATVSISRAEGIANARLMAAAPELLAEVQALRCAQTQQTFRAEGYRSIAIRLMELARERVNRYPYHGDIAMVRDAEKALADNRPEHFDDDDLAEVLSDLISNDEGHPTAATLRRLLARRCLRVVRIDEAVMSGDGDPWKAEAR